MWWVTRRRHSRLVRPKWTSLETPNWLEAVYSLYIFIQRHALSHICPLVLRFFVVTADRSPVIIKRKRINYRILPTSQNCHPAAVVSISRQVVRFIVACTSVHLLNLSGRLKWTLLTREETTSLQPVGTFLASGEEERSHQGSYLVIEPVSPERTHLHYPSQVPSPQLVTWPFSRPIILPF